MRSKEDYYLNSSNRRIYRFDGLSIFIKYVEDNYLSTQRYSTLETSTFINFSSYKNENRIHNFNNDLFERDII